MFTHNNQQVVSSTLSYNNNNDNGTTISYAPNHCNNHTNNLTTDPFPRLNAEELRSQLSRMSIELPPTIWTIPRAEDVQGLYSFAIEEIFDKHIEHIRLEETSRDFGTTSSPLLSKISGRDILPFEGRLHIRAIGNLRFFRYCQKLCINILRISDFNRNHLFRPDSSSVIRFASAFVNFLKFRECICSQLNNQIMEFDVLKNVKYIHVVEQSRLVESELTRCTTERKLKDNEFKELAESNNEMNTILQNLSIKHSKLLAVNNERRETISRLQTENNQLELTIVSLRQELDDLKDQIIHDPEKLIKKHQDICHNISLKKSQLWKMSAEKDKTKFYIDITDKINKKVLKLIDLFKFHIENRLKKYGEIRSEKKKISKEVEFFGRELGELTKEELKKKDKLNELREAHKIAQDKWKQEAINYEENFKQSELNRQLQQQKLHLIEVEINETNKEIEGIMHEIELEKEERGRMDTWLATIQEFLQVNIHNLTNNLDEMLVITQKTLAGDVSSTTFSPASNINQTANLQKTANTASKQIQDTPNSNHNSYLEPDLNLQITSNQKIHFNEIENSENIF